MKRAIFGFLAAWPFFMFAMMIVMLVVINAELPNWFTGAWLVATAVYAIGWIWYIWDVWHNARVPAEKRALWTAVLVFAGPYALPFYFWFYVR